MKFLRVRFAPERAGDAHLRVAITLTDPQTPGNESSYELSLRNGVLEVTDSSAGPPTPGTIAVDRPELIEYVIRGTKRSAQTVPERLREILAYIDLPWRNA